MPKQLLECIPNFSEARRPKVLKAIERAILAVPGALILDQHADLDHNRSVFTLLGPPKAVEEAAFQAIRQAAELIDMEQHSGAHPRIGATDVVPFVPISAISMLDCIEIARRLAKRVAHELEIPVYLYEEAATCPERVNLEDIRRGQYEGLKEEILTNSQRKPDFGPARLGKAGATVIGARQPLIAYNVYLTSDNVEIAKKIARQVRFSSGGLRFVKAMGVLVDGRAQVSMNLTNFSQTPIAQVVEFIRREATRYGVAIHHSELVGLIPQQALVDAAVWYTQLDQFEPQQILENKLQTDGEESAAVSAAREISFLDELASAEPTPGGGSAAAFTAAEAAALVAMVARLTVPKKKYEAVKQSMLLVIEDAEKQRAELVEAVDLDAAAFKQVMAAFRLPRENKDQQAVRTAAIRSANLEAARVPLHTIRLAVQVMHLAVQVATQGNLNAITDAGSAGILAKAAIAAAAANVRINTADIPSDKEAQQILGELADFELTASTKMKELEQVLSERAGIPLHL